MLKGFLGHFCDIDQFGGNRVRDEAYRTSFNVAVTMSAIAAHDCIATWQADFRADLPKIDVPVMPSRATRTRSWPSARPASDCPA